jgi:protein transport protein SEC24
MSQPQLPQGWAAQWDPQANRYLFIDTINNTSQWEEPLAPSVSQAAPPASSTPVPAAGANPRRRQYPTAQLAQAYADGGPQGVAGQQGGYQGGQAGQQGYDVAATQPQVGAYGQQQPAAQMFTPGVQAQPQAGGYFASAQQPGQQQQQQQQQPIYGDQKAFAAVGGQQPQSMNNMTSQFSGMSMAPNAGHPLISLNLIGLQPSIPSLSAPPPAPILPPGACMSNDPRANADYTYQRCTINAIPTTASLLGKSKVPFGLVLTPYRSLKEHDVSVHRDQEIR